MSDPGNRENPQKAEIMPECQSAFGWQSQGAKIRLQSSDFPVPPSIAVPPRRWVVQCSFGGEEKCCRQSKNCPRKPNACLEPVHRAFLVLPRRKILNWISLVGNIPTVARVVQRSKTRLSRPSSVRH